VIEYKTRILALEHDPAIIHGSLSKLMRQGEHDFDSLIMRAQSIFQQCPPPSLEKISGIVLLPGSCSSVYSSDWREFEENTAKSNEHRSLVQVKTQRKPWLDRRRFTLMALSTMAAAAMFLLEPSLQNLF